MLWVADITEMPRGTDFLYLADVLDALSRRIVGWIDGDHLALAGGADEFDLAVWQRWPSDVKRSAQGSQYISIEFGDRDREASVRTAMGSVGDVDDKQGGEILRDRRMRFARSASLQDAGRGAQCRRLDNAIAIENVSTLCRPKSH